MLGLARDKALPKRLDIEWEARVSGHVISLGLSPNGSMLAAASADGPITLIAQDTGRIHIEMAGHNGGTAQVEWRPGADTLASAGMDGKVRLWKGATGEQVTLLDCGTGWVECLAWSPRGEYLATATGRRLRLWDFTDSNSEGRLIREFPAQESTISDIGWKPGTEDVLASCGLNGLSLWSPTGETCTRHLPWIGSMLRLAWSPNGKYIVTGNQDSTIQFWLMETGKELRMWGYPSKIRELAWDSKSRYLATGGSATGVVWDCSGKGPAGSKPLLLDFHAALLTQLVFENEGLMIASGCQEGLVAVWRLGKDSRPMRTAHLGSAVTQLLWAGGNSRIVAATADGQVMVLRT